MVPFPKKNYPYIYLGIHKYTKQFYYGYRSANVVRSDKDLGKRYFTSSKEVKELGFKNFTWYIIKEFFTRNAKNNAYWEEQRLIEKYINNKLCLNSHYVKPDCGRLMYKTNKKSIEKMKLTLSKRTEEEKIQSKKNKSKAQRNISKEKWKITIKRRKETWRNKSKEEKLNVTLAHKKAWDKRSKEERSLSKYIQHERMTNIEKRLRAEKISNTLRNKSKEEKEKIREKVRITRENNKMRKKLNGN